METTDFSDTIKKKSNNQLIDILTNKDEYNPRLVIAAENELRFRRNQNTFESAQKKISEKISIIGNKTSELTNSNAIKNTGKGIKFFFAVILIIIGLVFTLFGLFGFLFQGPNTFVPLTIFTFILGIVILYLGIKIL